MADTIDAQVRAEQVRLIYEQAIPAQAISVFVAATVCAVLWRVDAHAALLSWFALIAILGIVRFALVQRFRASGARIEDPQRWANAFLISLAATGLAWGVGGWMLMPSQSLVHQAVVYFFLMGMAGGAVASYAAHAATTILAIGCVMLPSTLWLAFQDGLIPKAMAAGGLIYVGAAYRATHTLAFFLRRSFQLASEVERAREAAEQRARTDDLTSMRNRRAFYEQAEVALAQADRYAGPVSIVVLDIDAFKRINDTYGHSTGDRAIQAVARAIVETARASDLTARLGGDEFVMLLPNTSEADAMRQTGRLRAAIAAARIPCNGDEISLTCSLGIAERTAEHAGLEALLHHADMALYEAKRQRHTLLTQR